MVPTPRARQTLIISNLFENGLHESGSVPCIDPGTQCDKKIPKTRICMGKFRQEDGTFDLPQGIPLDYVCRSWICTIGKLQYTFLPSTRYFQTQDPTRDHSASSQRSVSDENHKFQECQSFIADHLVLCVRTNEEVLAGITPPAFGTRMTMNR
jgi:hypothetical protein